MEYADLMLVSGGIVRIEIPGKWYDEVLEAIDNARFRRDWWAPGMHEGTRATYQGVLLARVDMSQVIGML